MALSKKSDLITAVYDFLLRDEATDIVITSDRVSQYIRLCEAELNRELLINDIKEVDDTLETTASVKTVALPDDFNAPVALSFGDMLDDVTFVSDSVFRTKYRLSGNGRPKWWTIIGDKIYLAPTPDAAYPLELSYYQTITALDSPDDTNKILQRHPDVYLYGAIKQALFNISDAARLADVDSNYTGIVKRIKEYDKQQRWAAATAGTPDRRIG